MAERQIILDTETTGLNAYDPVHPDRLIEFAGLEMINRQFTGNSLHLYVHPQRDIPDDAAAVHGITLDQLADKPVFAQVAQQILDFISGAELIIHNAKFDVGFLNAEFARVGLPEVQSVCTITDTLAMAREKYPGQKASLDALCNRLGVDRSRRVLHGALIDCELLGGVYLAMTRGQFSLVDGDVGTPNTVSGSSETPSAARPAKLKVLAADADETAAHEAYLDGLGNSLYRRTEENA
ncbi:MAG: DNA polymerase III subunit epsilon [Conchiformibius sp.]|nr:DNA polymerase III subunit epsilon [Conchiformibius sp.]